MTKEIDFIALDKEAKDILKQRAKQYCGYKEHVENYSKILKNLRADLANLLYEKGVRNEVEFCIADHAAHNVALKLSRIIANPSYKDSYVDCLGYLLLFLQNTQADYVLLRKIDFLGNNHAVNKLIDSINTHYKRR